MHDCADFVIRFYKRKEKTREKSSLKRSASEEL